MLLILLLVPIAKSVKNRRFKWIVGAVVSASAALGAAMYVAYRARDDVNTSTDQSMFHNKEIGVEEGFQQLDLSIKTWEASLRVATDRGDEETVARLRQVLRRAYTTLECFDRSIP